MNVVYIVIYSNHFEEEWNIHEVFEDKVAAERERDRMTKEHGGTWRNYSVETWDIK